jgi:ABC-type branched-subunit amino acid transport system substrate-binding protein
VRDSGGDAKRAAAAVRELAEEEDVAAIVGPLVSDACEAAAREAERLEVPLLALTARERVASEHRWVFRVRTRPVEETQLVADRAIALGAKRFAILYRDDAYGRGLRGLFWDAVEARGGEVVAVASYDPAANDFADPIKQLVGYTLLDDEQKRALASRNAMLERAKRMQPGEARALRARAYALTTSDGRPIPPIVDFDALFIPESSDKVVLIAPQLLFHEVRGPRLLGSVGWYDEELVRLAGEQLEGALFAADFFPESPVPYVEAFRRRFESHFGAEPDAFAAQAYDAASLVLLQLARGRSEREDLRDGLLAVESFPGVAGVLTMRADGNASRRPFLLTIEGGRVAQVVD